VNFSGGNAVVVESPKLIITLGNGGRVEEARAFFTYTVRTPRGTYGCLPGYSDHTADWDVLMCAVAMGAQVVEIHITLPDYPGPDADAWGDALLDAGALGIIAPHVANAQEARAVVRACKFAPQGDRSAAGNWPHVGYRPGEPVALRAAFNAATTVVVMLESPEAVERADEIAAVPGVDIVHVGTVDLCDALGRPGDYGQPEVMACHERVIRACQRHGKVAGAGGLAHTPALVRQVLEMGARFVTAGVEWDLMMAGVRQRVDGIRQLRT
jgi:2-keto-3-deoxy-L-rhamnonate aldolase RhmA